jgi:formylglycine-generating enzyme
MDERVHIGDSSSLLEVLGEGFEEVNVCLACNLKDDLRAISSRVALSSSGSVVRPPAHRVRATWQVVIAVLMGWLLSDATHASEPQNTSMVAIPAGTFESVLPASDQIKRVAVGAFRLDITPVTNGQFARFVRKNPQWQRDQVARLFADEQYLRHWSSSTQPAQSSANQPVVHVSWFAASAYCESRGARLPTWHEWEYVAAASESKRDARSDPQWRQQILAWYSQSGRGELPAVGLTPANVYGARDIHGVVWEWIEDLPSLLVANDSREQGDPNQMRFCGAGAVSMEGKENYAMLMRIAMLSSMKANYTSATMGFRCATDGASNP